ncbi:hypothetical protein AHF37_08573 [Paragonimus kellicotti]|nr:hypothetical protein AHF37_08573 [Paragonimus kellicotti]
MVFSDDFNLSDTRMHGDLELCLADKNRIPQNKEDQVIHIAIILSGVQNKVRFTTLVKNILYYQGRFNDSSAMCSLNITAPRNYVCHKRNATPYYPLQFHLIADADERDFVTGAFARWPIEDVTFIFYDYDLAAVSLIPLSFFCNKSPNSSGFCVELFLPDREIMI